MSRCFIPWAKVLRRLPPQRTEWMWNSEQCFFSSACECLHVSLPTVTSSIMTSPPCQLHLCLSMVCFLPLFSFHTITHAFHFHQFSKLLYPLFDVVGAPLLTPLYLFLPNADISWNPGTIHLFVKTFSPWLHFSTLHWSVTHASHIFQSFIHLCG